MKTNETLRNAFKEFWTLTPVEFLSGTEFNKIVSSGDTKYAAFLAYDGEHTLTMQRLDGFNGPVIHEKSFNFSHFDLALSLITGPNKDTPVATPNKKRRTTNFSGGKPPRGTKGGGI
ncbi:MAG: hypothetical protein IPK08_07525 [Bacteroidetes bacterium]|nr:hypothetical protein [Bacteroidota bacterium]